METVLGVVTNLFSVVTDILDTVKTEPILLIPIAGTVGGIGIGWYKSLTNQRKKKRG